VQRYLRLSSTTRKSLLEKFLANSSMAKKSGFGSPAIDKPRGIRKLSQISSSTFCIVA
jgi:hypothetical protein